jgi:hypothetical protein
MIFYHILRRGSKFSPLREDFTSPKDFYLVAMPETNYRTAREIEGIWRLKEIF